MTSLITDVLTERAERAGAPALDLDRLVADGDARARRTRVTRVAGGAGAGLLAAAALAAVALVGLDGSGTDAGTDPAAEPASRAPSAVSVTRLLSYATDDTIVLPQADRELRAPSKVVAYVPTDDGFVTMAPDGVVSLVPADRSPSITIGRTDPAGGALRAEKAGSLAAWIDFSGAQGPELVVYDTFERAEVLRTGENLGADADAYRDSADPAYVYAVDRGSVYWLNEAGAVRTDVATGRSEVLDPGAGGFTIGDVAAGQIASTATTGAGDDSDASATRVGPNLEEGTVLPWSGNDRLSPDAAHVSFEDEDALVVADVATGREVGPANPGYDYWVVTQWIGEDTFAVMGLRSIDDLDNPDGPDTAPLDFLTCEVGDSSCEVVTTAEVDLDGFTLPVGEAG